MFPPGMGDPHGAPSLSELPAVDVGAPFPKRQGSWLSCESQFPSLPSACGALEAKTVSWIPVNLSSGAQSHFKMLPVSHFGITFFFFFFSLSYRKFLYCCAWFHCRTVLFFPPEFPMEQKFHLVIGSISDRSSARKGI